MKRINLCDIHKLTFKFIQKSFVNEYFKFSFAENFIFFTLFYSSFFELSFKKKFICRKTFIGIISEQNYRNKTKNRFIHSFLLIKQKIKIDFLANAS